jgi:hypothetical protein
MSSVQELDKQISKLSVVCKELCVGYTISGKECSKKSSKTNNLQLCHIHFKKTKPSVKNIDDLFR